ncbi:MAG TPA: phage tail sheath subtilisin-like domain-containing protein, partial [Burkholderiales bacterium]|nr:phage tail sheath subtilisin-like domain-containing protein [Burkholderiales bacterium]
GDAADSARDGAGAPNYLWHAVKGFFDNGGGRVYVTRLQGDASEVDERALAEALRGLEANEEVSLLCAPGVRLAQGHAQLCNLLLRHCERTSGRFALLDTPPGAAPDAARALRGHLQSDRGALYYPWIAVQAAAPIGAADAAGIVVPPSGHLAGLYADSDDQPGIHKAPANLPIAGALGLERPVGDADYARLAPLGVNCLRSPPGRRGAWVWGARTLGTDSGWNYVAVCRYLLYLRKALEHGLRWVHAQPGSGRLWEDVTALVSEFLYREWRMGALMGGTPAEAYAVQCQPGAGRATLAVGVALVQPADFVRFSTELAARA